MPFSIGQRVRYKPGYGTYGYEDLVESDGRIPAMVLGFGKPQRHGPRVKIEFFRNKTALRRAVDAGNLILDRELGAGEAAAALGSFVSSKLEGKSPP